MTNDYGNVMVREVPLAALRPAEYNPRKALLPGDAEYEKLKRSVEAFGYICPIVWNERSGNVVGGHQTPVTRYCGRGIACVLQAADCGCSRPVCKRRAEQRKPMEFEVKRQWRIELVLLWNSELPGLINSAV
jgi:hypothetical protein